MSFRSAERTHYQDILTRFKELLKQFNPLAHQKNQGPTLELTSGAKPTLDDVQVRPGISGKKTVGRLELHKNGFKFRSRRSEEFDFLISNIKGAAYMPADEEEIFIIHFEMREPIIYGGKRVRNLQFFVKLDDANENLIESSEKRKVNRDSRASNDRHSDRFYSQRISAAEDAFNNFIKAVEKESKNQIIFEKPDLEEGFLGSLEYDQLYIYPTQNSLIGLTTHPYIFIGYDELELVAFERVGMMNKTFDIAFIFKDYSREVIRLSSIASNEKSRLKKLFDSKDIIVFEHNSGIKWQPLLLKFSETIEEFIEDGAWETLGDKDDSKRDSNDGSSQSNFDDSEDGDAFSEDDEDFDSDDEFDEDDDDEDDSGDGKDDGSGDDEDEFEDDDEDPYSEDGSNEDDYEVDSEDSMIVRKKGEEKKKKKGNGFGRGKR